MKYFLFFFLGFGLLACQQEIDDKPLSRELTAVQTQMDAYFTALTELQKFNGVVLVSKNDTILLERAYNLFNNEDSSTFISVSHQFDIHSVSKLMTHFLIAQLEAEGALSEAQTIDSFFPDFPRGDEITIGMLLDHSSGLPRELLNFDGDEFELGPEEIVEAVKKESLLFDPGTDKQYSNVGYELVYRLIAQVYEKPFSQCIHEEIFLPLDMSSSGAHFFKETDRLEKPAQNHVLQDSIITSVPNIAEDEFRTARLYSTASDLYAFLESVEKEPYRTSLKSEDNIIAKDGGSDGIRAQVYTDLENGFRFVLLSNYDEMPFFKTIEDVVKILKSEPVEIPREINRKAIEVDLEVLERYVGSYTFPDFDGLVLRIEIEEEGLVVFQGDEKIAKLKAESETVFYEDPKAAESFEFIENENGTFNSLMGWKGIVVEGKRE